MADDRTALERVLEAIDSGLQSSTERGYGTDVLPGRCARCQLHRPGPEGGDLCFLCRGFLLGDFDRDPARSPASPAAYELVVMDEQTAEFVDAMRRLRDSLDPDPAEVERLAAGIREFADQVWTAFRPVVELVTAAVTELVTSVGESTWWRDLVAAAHAALPGSPPTARDRERDLLDERRRSHRRTNRWGPPPGRNR